LDFIDLDKLDHFQKSNIGSQIGIHRLVNIRVWTLRIWYSFFTNWEDEFKNCRKCQKKNLSEIVLQTAKE
jgi:hypothetical protein